ncbi:MULTISPECIES: hypothetical protein [Methanobacterium]|uniref:Uncharacterized protein n=1 Tax=Methanobacterium veterum TaxID=408577 RepID=A0A9E4ZUE4_9EURY|nr:MULTISPECIES: hypothetical protein [Methanobacterium]MCZ3364296.1 hypothetical protein [Methanobacterium veterum]MCZ3372043.1 hypothetical protein [Methanobacterium veterum]
MKNKLVISVISIFILSITSPVVFADVIEPGMKEVKLYYTISNINKYPDYIFLIHGTPSPSYEIINSSEFSFYKLSTVSIYAIKKSNFNETELSSNAHFYNYFKNNPDIIRSNIKLDGSYKQVNINDPLEKACVLLDINSINGSTMEINKSKIIFTYTDGTSQEKIFKDQNITPEPSNKSNLALELWYIVIPVLAIIAIVIIIISRKFK